MIRLAEHALKGPMAAAGVSSGLLCLGLLLPLLAGPAGVFITLPVIWCSAAIVSLVLLRQGVAPALTTLGTVLLMVLLMGLLSRGGMLQLIAIIAQFWLPAVLVAYVLRQSVSLDLAVLSGAAIGILLIVLLHLFVGDPVAFWERVLGNHIDAGLSANGTAAIDPRAVQQAETLRASIGVMARLATPATAVMMMLTGVTSVFLARGWQARLFNPGGFQQEFHSLRFGKTAALGVLALTGASLVLDWSLLSHVVIVLLTAMMFQGLAVLHALVKIRGMSNGWLVGVYALMILPHTSALVGALGLADNWLNLRRLPPETRSVGRQKMESGLSQGNQSPGAGETDNNAEAPVTDGSANFDDPANAASENNPSGTTEKNPDSSSDRTSDPGADSNNETDESDTFKK